MESDLRYSYCVFLTTLSIDEPLIYQGDLISLKMFNTQVVVVNSASVARDLLEKRGANYSDRPHSTWMSDMYVVSLHIFTIVD